MAFELTLNRLLDAPADKLFRLWTDPSRMNEWFCPKPWTVSKAELDVRPGGACNITMQGPNGEVMPNPGQYLEIVPNRKIVFTDAFTGDWRPKDGAPFMVATVTFEPEGNKTRYIAVDTEKDEHTAAGAKKSVMIWDTQSQEVVGNNVYDVKSPPAVGSTAKFDTYSAEYVGSGS